MAAAADAGRPNGGPPGNERGTAERPALRPGPTRPEPPVRAAGCVLWRPRRASGGGGVEVALIHRPKYDDWSHPKGKLHPAESAEQAAVREVLEETGMSCVLGAPLTATRYLAKGRPKEVRYWAAEATGGRFTPNGEVDQLRWLSPDQARIHLTHPIDRPVLDEALAAVAGARGDAGDVGKT